MSPSFEKNDEPRRRRSSATQLKIWSVLVAIAGHEIQPFTLTHRKTLTKKGMQNENSRLRSELENEKIEADISLQRFFINFEDLKFDKDAKPLGKGATAVVLRATLYLQEVAVKKVSARTIEQEEECSNTLLKELRTCVSCTVLGPGVLCTGTRLERSKPCN